LFVKNYSRKQTVFKLYWGPAAHSRQLSLQPNGRNLQQFYLEGSAGQPPLPDDRLAAAKETRAQRMKTYIFVSLQPHLPFLTHFRLGWQTFFDYDVCF
jgi:hypothetical protein